MDTRTPRVMLGEMTSVEAAARLRQARLVLLPTGATEQHGPNLALETDIVIATELARGLAAQHAPHVLVAPPLPIGLSNHHMHFPGTLTWSFETFSACIRETIRALRAHGMERFLVINGHGGNQGALSVLCTQLRYQEGVRLASCFWFDLVRDVCLQFIPRRRAHGDEIETALAMHLAPRLVRTPLAPGQEHPDPFPYTDPTARGGIELAYAWEELTANGVFGDARRATPAMGAELTAAILERAGAFVKAFIAERPTSDRQRARAADASRGRSTARAGTRRG